VTIAQARDASVPPNPGIGDDVIFENVVVTGVRKLPAGSSSNGFYLSDETQGPWHCIFVHTGSTVQTAAVGDRITIKGTLAEYNGLNQLASNFTITQTTPGAPLTELDVTIAELVGANAESYESCRVRVQNVTGVTAGTGMALQQSGQQINASKFIWEGTTFVTAGATYAQVKGFPGVFQSNREMLPQVDADIVP
jgi:predicted extracellular nuclease